MVSLICENCSRPFSAERNTRRYCSRPCAWSRAGKFHRPLVERFWANVQKAERCWVWIGATSTAGYGQIGNNNKVLYAHRISWELHNGPIAPDAYICHKCDNPPCVNPGHLFIGTPKDNVLDMISKGRRGKTAHSCGSAHYYSKLTEPQVVEIRRRYAEGGITMKELGAKYGIAATNISNIVKHRSWKHV